VGRASWGWLTGATGLTTHASRLFHNLFFFLFPSGLTNQNCSFQGQPLGISPGILARCDLRLLSVSDQLCQLSVFRSLFSPSSHITSRPNHLLAVVGPWLSSWPPSKRPVLCWFGERTDCVGASPCRLMPPVLGPPSLSLPSVSSHFQQPQSLCPPPPQKKKEKLCQARQSVLESILELIFAAKLRRISEIRGRGAAPTSLMQRSNSPISSQPGA
jgi:hypothetical protein